MKQQSLKIFLKEETGPYELPKGWKWVRLGEVCEINPSKKEITHISDDLEVSFIPMDAVDEGQGEIVSPEIRKIKDVRKGYTYFKEGDVIFAKITPCMENGKCAIAKNLVNKLGFGSTEFHVIRPLNSVLSEWIWFYLRQQHIREEATKYFTGSVGQQRVPKEFLENLLLPLPPLPEQKRIVARIEALFSKIDEIKRLRKEANDLAKTLPQSTLHEVFSKADEKGWRWVRLGEVLKEDRKTINPQDYPAKNFWLVTMDCVESNTGKLLNKINLCGKEIKSTKYQFNFNHVLYGKLRPYLNKVYAVPEGEKGICTTEFIPFIVINAIKNYVTYYLRTRQVVNFAMNNLIGTRQPRVDINALLDFQIPLPSLPEQKRIVAYFDSIQQKAQVLQKLQEETEKEIEKLREAILYKAFRGEL